LSRWHPFLKEFAIKNVTGFRPHLSAVQAHEALQKNIKIADAAQPCAVLWFGEIMLRRLYRELGYSSMRAYALEELDFSSTRAGDFMRLARSSRWQIKTMKSSGCKLRSKTAANTWCG